MFDIVIVPVRNKNDKDSVSFKIIGENMDQYDKIEASLDNKEFYEVFAENEYESETITFFGLDKGFIHVAKFRVVKGVEYYEVSSRITQQEYVLNEKMLSGGGAMFEEKVPIVR